MTGRRPPPLSGGLQQEKLEACKRVCQTGGTRVVRETEREWDSLNLLVSDTEDVDFGGFSTQEEDGDED